MRQFKVSLAACQSRKRSFWLRFFGHLARSAPEEDHHRVIAAALRPPTDWRRPVGRPRTTRLRTTDEDVQPQNFGVHTAWKKARDRDTWQQVVSTFTSNNSTITKIMVHPKIFQGGFTPFQTYFKDFSAFVNICFFFC